MAGQHTHPVVPSPARRLRFDQFVLDIAGGRLLRGGSDIPLRPKTFAVLRHFAENPHRLISKDELFAAVWPNLTVTDDVLVQSIGELRRALGNDGAGLIKTMPRRGYRFDAAVQDLLPADPKVATGASGPVSSADHTLSLVTPIRVQARPRPSIALALLAFAGIAAALSILSYATATLHPHSKLSSMTSSAAKPAIAVLPFVNHGGDAAHDYFADGLTQDVINALGRFSALTVMSWNAVLPYKGKPAPPGEVGRTLAVRYQIEARLQQLGDRVRVTAQLVGTDGRVLWSGRFDEPLADVFALPDKMTNEIAGALAIKVTQQEQRRVAAKPTESLEAYDRVLRARPALQRPTRAGNVEARTMLKRAIELDPNYAAAYSALAETYYIDVSMGWTQAPAATLAQAEHLAAKALSINEMDVRARVILGRIHILYHRYEQAKAEIERAIAINPSDAQGLAGRGNILMWLGQADAAIDALELAQRIDPELSAIDRFSLSLAYYLKRRYGAAIEQAELNLRATSDAHFSRVVLAAAYAQNNQADAAADTVALLRRLDPTFNAQDFGTKLLNATDLEHLREGLRKARLQASN